MVHTKGSETARSSQSQKVHPSPDWSLQLDSMKLESLVIRGQHTRVNAFPGLVHTARHTTKVGFTRSR
jgi:ribosomal protein L19